MDNDFVPSGYVNGDFGEDRPTDFGRKAVALDDQGKSPLELAVESNDLRMIEHLLRANYFRGEFLDVILQRQPLRLGMIRKIFEKLTLQEIIDFNLAQYLHSNDFELSQVAHFGNVELIKFLLDRAYYTVDERDFEDGKTALHVAVKKHDLAMVKMLVEYGANVDALDDDKRTPLAYLYNEGSDSHGLKILKILLTRATLLITGPASWARLQIIGILKYGCEEAVELILRRTHDYLEVSNETGNSALHYLLGNRDARAIETLRHREFDVDARNSWRGCTALQTAVEGHSPHAVELLLEKGADVRAVDDEGCDPLLGLIRTLHCDCRFEEARECVRLLLEYGSDAARSECFDVVSRLHDELVEHRPEDAGTLLSVVEPMLAHLATGEARGIEIGSACLSSIERHRSWVEYFGMCERQVEGMAATRVFGSVTLLRFLTESEKKITGYARNEELVLELRRIIENFDVTSPYFAFLRKRLLKATRSAELRDKAVSAVGRVVGSKSNAHYLPAGYIVDRLSSRDMKCLHCAFDS